MSERYQSTRRCYLIDHHSPQPPIVPLDHMDISEYEQFFDQAELDSLMVYCKDHWGVTYYNSHVEGAQKHQGIHGDWIQEVRDLTRRKNIEFVAYYCIEYDEGAARKFPEWRVLKADGTPLIRDDLYAKWSLMCYQTGYREYALSQLEEIISGYQPDSLFLDIFGASLCYCSACRSKFRKRFGYELPEEEEQIRIHCRDISSFLNQNAEEFYQELKERLKKISPSLAITINFSCHYPKTLRRLLDYQYSEPLLKDNWFSSAYARDTAVGQYPMLAPGEASQVYNYDSAAQYICDLSSIAAQGCRVGMYSGSQHIDGTLEHHEAENLGMVFHELKKMEPYLSSDRHPVCCAGIIQSDLSKSISSDGILSDAILRMKKHNPHTYAILGAMMACEQAKLPYQVLPDVDITVETLKKYDLIICPEVYVISPDLSHALKEYVQSGGKMIISACSGLYDENLNKTDRSSLEELIGCRYISTHEEFRQNGWSAYLQPEHPDDFSGLMAVTTPPVSQFFLEVSPAQAQKLSHFILPCVACSETEWINWWSPPPGKVTEMPSVTLNQYGNGNVLYLAYDFFTMSAEETYRDTRSSFQDFLRVLKIHPSVWNQTEIPDILRTAYFETDSSYQIHQVSTIPSKYNGQVIPVSGGSVQFQNRISKAYRVYPEYQELQIQEENDLWTVALPEFTLQQFIVFEK